MSMQTAKSSDPLTRQLRIRLTESEHAALEQEAREAGLTVSDVVRQRLTKRRGASAKRAMDRAAAPVQEVQMAPELFAQLSRIGNNLNQMAKAFNAGQGMDRNAVYQLVRQAWATMMADEVGARYASMAEAKTRARVAP